MDIYRPRDTLLVSNVAREGKRVAHPWSILCCQGYAKVRVGLEKLFYENTYPYLKATNSQTRGHDLFLGFFKLYRGFFVILNGQY